MMFCAAESAQKPAISAGRIFPSRVVFNLPAIGYHGGFQAVTAVGSVDCGWPPFYCQVSK